MQSLFTLVHAAKLVQIIGRGLSLFKLWLTGNNAATNTANRQYANLCRTDVITETTVVTKTEVEIKLNLPRVHHIRHKQW